MKTQSRKWTTGLRVVWAIFAKDLREVLRNKSTISVLISGLFIVGMYRMLPVITEGAAPLRVWVYDQGQSGLAAFLENSMVLEARTGVGSLDKLEEGLRRADRPTLGLVIPADFDQRLESGDSVTLQGYIMNWIGPKKAGELKQAVEDEVALLLGRRVPIDIEGNVLHLLPEESGPGLQAALATVFLLTLIGANMIPHLMIVEKQERTLDALLVSPANEVHVVLAKALTGMVYCLIGGTIALAVNSSVVIHWGLAVLGIVCFSLFAVALGLALGSKIESRAQLSVWAWVIFIPMFMPAIAVLLEGLVPEPVIQIMRFTPTVAFTAVWRYSFAQPISWFAPLGWLAYLLLWAGLAIVFVILLMRRRDRETVEIAAALAVPSKMDHSSGSREEKLPSRAAVPVPSMGRVEAAPRSGLRILWAVFAKDMREALSNKLLLSILIGTAIVIFNGAALPLLIDLQWKPSSVIYDEGRSTIVRGLVGMDEIRLRLADSRAEFEEILTAGPGTWLGIVIPADFDQRAGDPDGIMLAGYRAHWADQDRIQDSVSIFEEQLGLAAWSTVSIDLEGNDLFPTLDAGGQISINLMTALIAMTAIGVALVPLLVVEEKESHTLDALLVSPAHISEVVLGKAFVGGVYCLLALTVALWFNRTYIVHWDMVLLATLFSAAFAVSLGMLVGVLADNPTSAGMWATPMILIILVTALAYSFASPTWPAIVQDLLAWSPGSVMMRLLHFSVAGEVPTGRFLSNLAALAGLTTLVYLLVGWRIRRLYQ